MKNSGENTHKLMEAWERKFIALFPDKTAAELYAQKLMERENVRK